MKIKLVASIMKIPGGMMIVPMLITALINTFTPGLLTIGEPTSSILTSVGTMTIIGLLLFITGTQLRYRQLPDALRRGGIFCLFKILIGVMTGLLLFHFTGNQGIGGISTLAFVVVMSSCHPGIYLTLVRQYGDKVDESAFGFLNLLSVPLVPVLILSYTNGKGGDITMIIATLFPFVLGLVLGNLDGELAKLSGPAAPVCLIFLGFCFGADIQLENVIRAGMEGLLLTLIFIVVNLPVMLLVDWLILRRPGYAAAAMVNVAGIAVALPGIIVKMMPVYRPWVPDATAQIAMVVIITSLISPALAWLIKKYSPVGYLRKS